MRAYLIALCAMLAGCGGRVVVDETDLNEEPSGTVGPAPTPLPPGKKPATFPCDPEAPTEGCDDNKACTDDACGSDGKCSHTPHNCP